MSGEGSLSSSMPSNAACRPYRSESRRSTCSVSAWNCPGSAQPALPTRPLWSRPFCEPGAPCRSSSMRRPVAAAHANALSTYSTVGAYGAAPPNSQCPTGKRTASIPCAASHSKILAGNEGVAEVREASLGCSIGLLAISVFIAGGGAGEQTGRDPFFQHQPAAEVHAAQRPAFPAGRD